MHKSVSTGAIPIPPGTATPATPLPAPTTTRAQFITRADAICTELHAKDRPLELRAEALSRQASTASRGVLADLFEESIALARAADAKLSALARPGPDRSAIAALLRGYGSEAQDVSALATALRNDEPTLQESSEAALRGTESADKALARSLGLTACAQA